MGKGRTFTGNNFPFRQKAFYQASDFDKVDEKDWAIIDILRRNSRTSNSDIGRELNVSEGTIRKRIQKLLEEGAIKKFTVVLRNEGVEGIILIRTEPRKAKELLEFIRGKFDELYEFSGRFDLAIKVNCKSLDELNRIVDELRVIDGVRNTDTLIRLH